MRLTELELFSDRDLRVMEVQALISLADSVELLTAKVYELNDTITDISDVVTGLEAKRRH
ncbi:hypothetical protein [Corynebacterium gallinarum]|uniref:Uncharacterized protein n=1 Tax=Corynebacterium gallinarum TaxID=2762214 RepID=A0A8I0HNY1_9CORY|nr:hypothetical protein [Corynebacterium gallinarum]MBD8030279.1 hypothetical protein [Corynebacterium gallinarum]